MIKVSEAAKTKVLELMQEDGFNPAKDYVRVGVKSGGCSGLSYDLKFDNSQIESDKLFENNGVKIIVDAKSFLYLVGTTLEYSGGLNGAGFVFKNPNANKCRVFSLKSKKILKSSRFRISLIKFKALCCTFTKLFKFV